MNANARAARAARREMIRDAVASRRTTRRVADARRAVATGTPQTARVHLLNAGLSVEDAERFAAAFSRGVATGTGVDRVVRVRRRNATQANHYAVVRRTVKTYTLETFRARLAVYRPKSDTTAAARFSDAADAFALAA